MGWSDVEMNSLKIGDKRLDKRLKKTIEQMAASSDCSFPACFKTRAELIGAYRLFDNEFVTTEKILQPHFDCVAQRSATQPLVLLLNDTSSIDYTSRQIDNLGILEKTYTQGFFLHLGEFMIMIGTLGGYQKRKSPPGVKVIWEGLKKLNEYVLMWNSIHATLSTKNCV